MNRRSFLSKAAMATATSGAAASTAALASSATPIAPKNESSRCKVLIRPMPEEELRLCHEVAPSAELVVCPDNATVRREIVEADATFGIYSPELFDQARQLRWIQYPSAGVESICSNPEVVASDVVVTNMQRAYGPPIADHAIGFLLALSRRIDGAIASKSEASWQRGGYSEAFELLDQTMVIVGLGGIGNELARRAFGFGMRVLATDPKVIEKPLYVEELHKPEALDSLLPRANVLASCAPLTPVTRKMFDAEAFGLLPEGSIFLNVSRGGLVDTDALMAALDSGRIAGAGLDVTDPEPLPNGHPLWSKNTIITPHVAARSPGSTERRYQVFRENLGRFSRGEMLINIVDKTLGY